MAGVSAKLFSPLARAQYGAVLRMRWRMHLNRLRTRQGKFELGARILATVFFTGVWLAIGTGFGFAAFQFASTGRLHLLSLLLWPVLLIWQLLPVMIASAQQDSDLGVLLRFPVSFGSYALLYLCLGIFDLSSQMGVLALAGIAIGVVVVKPALALCVVPALALFAFFNLLLTRMIFAWIERWLARRRTREILGMVFLAFFLSLQLLNPALHRRAFGMSHAGFAHAVRTVDAAQRFSPPGLTALAIDSSAGKRFLPAAAFLLGVAAYTLAAGVVLGLRLRAEFRGESLGESPQAAPSMLRPEARSAARFSSGAQGWRDGPVGGVLLKEIHYLARSGVMLLGLVTPLIFLFAAGRSSVGMGATRQYAFPLAVAYAFLPLTRQICNSLGAEGAGIQLYFLASTPFRTIMLSKNLLQIGMFCVEVALAAAVAIARFGRPHPELAIATVCWLLFALPANLAAGNILSITMAYRMTLTRVSREQGSVGNGLLSLLVQVLIFTAGVAVYLPLALAGHGMLAVPVLLAMAFGAVLLWRRVLSNVDRLMSGRREDLLATLVRPA